MGNSKLQIPKICVYCGNTFLAKTIKTMYCSRKCAWSASNDMRKKRQQQKVLDNIKRIKRIGKEYITITEALEIFTTSRNTIHRLIISNKIKCLKMNPKRVFVCVNDLEMLFPIKANLSSKNTDKPIHIFDLNPNHCYTIGEITKRFNVSEKTVYKHIRQYSIPIRQVGNFVYAPKKEIDNLYNNKKAKK